MERLRRAVAARQRRRSASEGNLDASVGTSLASPSASHGEAAEETELHAAAATAEDAELEEEVLGAIGAALGRGALSGAHAWKQSLESRLRNRAARAPSAPQSGLPAGVENATSPPIPDPKLAPLPRPEPTTSPPAPSPKMAPSPARKKERRRSGRGAKGSSAKPSPQQTQTRQAHAQAQRRPEQRSPPQAEPEEQHGDYEPMREFSSAAVRQVLQYWYWHNANSLAASATNVSSVDPTDSQHAAEAEMSIGVLLQMRRLALLLQGVAELDGAAERAVALAHGELMHGWVGFGGAASGVGASFIDGVVRPRLQSLARTLVSMSQDSCLHMRRRSLGANTDTNKAHSATAIKTASASPSSEPGVDVAGDKSTAPAADVSDEGLGGREGEVTQAVTQSLRPDTLQALRAPLLRAGVAPPPPLPPPPSAMGSSNESFCTGAGAEMGAHAGASGHGWRTCAHLIAAWRRSYRHELSNIPMPAAGVSASAPADTSGIVNDAQQYRNALKQAKRDVEREVVVVNGTLVAGGQSVSRTLDLTLRNVMNTAMVRLKVLRRPRKPRRRPPPVPGQPRRRWSSLAKRPQPNVGASPLAQVAVPVPVEPPHLNATWCRPLVERVMLACSRTVSGGDSFFAVRALLLPPPGTAADAAATAVATASDTHAAATGWSMLAPARLITPSRTAMEEQPIQITIEVKTVADLERQAARERRKSVAKERRRSHAGDGEMRRRRTKGDGIGDVSRFSASVGLKVASRASTLSVTSSSGDEAHVLVVTVRTHSQFDVYDIASVGAGASALHPDVIGGARERSQSRSRPSLAGFLRRRPLTPQQRQDSGSSSGLGVDDARCWLTVKTVLTEEIRVDLRQHLSSKNLLLPTASQHAKEHQPQSSRRWSQPDVMAPQSDDQSKQQSSRRWLSILFAEPPSSVDGASGRDAEEGCLTDIDLTSSSGDEDSSSEDDIEEERFSRGAHGVVSLQSGLRGRPKGKVRTV